MVKFKIQPSGWNPVRTKKEANKLAEKIRKAGNRARIVPARQFARSRGARYEVHKGQKTKR